MPTGPGALDLANSTESLCREGSGRLQSSYPRGPGDVAQEGHTQGGVRFPHSLAEASTSWNCETLHLTHWLKTEEKGEKSHGKSKPYVQYSFKRLVSMWLLKNNRGTLHTAEASHAGTGAAQSWPRREEAQAGPWRPPPPSEWLWLESIQLSAAQAARERPLTDLTPLLLPLTCVRLEIRDAPPTPKMTPPHIRVPSTPSALKWHLQPERFLLGCWARATEAADGKCGR